MSSTSCRPFLEENDISRQAEKPIYAKDQDNDGQTQRTGQTMVSCAAVRTEHKTASASTEHKHTSDTNSSHPSEVQTLQNLNQNTSTTCYNRFLRYYKLPILLPSQTIGSFLRYIHDNYPQYYSQQYIKISIYINKTTDYKEAHIYLPDDPTPLSNHSLLRFEDLLLCDKILLKSSPSNPTILPQSTNPLLTLNIATHNVQGYNNPEKKLLWEEYCSKNNLHIISITETKIADLPSNRFLNTSQFSYFWSNSLESKEGTGIMISNILQPHVHNILNHPGGAIAIDIFFKHDFKFRIISVYLSSTNSTTRNKTQNKVIQWLQQALQHQLHPIILGDFNASMLTSLPSSSKYLLLNHLNRSNMYDLASYTNTLDHTWSSNRYSSRIDYIWAAQPIIPYLTTFYLDDPSSSTHSDHQILISQWSFPTCQQPKHKHRNKRRTFNYKAMTTEKWEDFTNQINHYIQYHHIPLNTTTTESLEKTWHKIQISIINAALSHIPNHKYTIRNFTHTFTPKATNLHKDLKNISKIIYHTKTALKNNTPISQPTYDLIDYINTKHNFQIPPPPHHPDEFSNWLNSTKPFLKTIYHARNLENSQHLCNHISQAIQRRQEKLLTQPTKMINSILNRHKDPVHFHNITTTNQVITDPTLIKQHISHHFEQWTHHQPYNQTIFDQYWSQEYTPISTINPSWYNSILQPITLEEVQNTISQLPNNKACGPSGISYEMLKHIGPNMLQAITSLLNRCIQSQNIPKQWKDSRIYPISKKPQFDGNLNNTRPISLIEHTKKLYTKILTNRLNQTLSEHSILNPHNYIALPGNSTNTPIHILNNFIEHAYCNKQQLWLLSQDMSKAYDSVNIDLLKLSLRRLQFPNQLINILTNLLLFRSNQVITNLGLSPRYPVQDGIDQGETITPLL